MDYDDYRAEHHPVTAGYRGSDSGGRRRRGGGKGGGGAGDRPPGHPGPSSLRSSGRGRRKEPSAYESDYDSRPRSKSPFRAEPRGSRGRSKSPFPRDEARGETEGPRGGGGGRGDGGGGGSGPRARSFGRHRSLRETGGFDEESFLPDYGGGGGGALDLEKELNAFRRPSRDRSRSRGRDRSRSKSRDGRDQSESRRGDASSYTGLGTIESSYTDSRYPDPRFRETESNSLSELSPGSMGLKVRGRSGRGRGFGLNRSSRSGNRGESTLLAAASVQEEEYPPNATRSVGGRSASEWRSSVAADDDTLPRGGARGGKGGKRRGYEDVSADRYDRDADPYDSTGKEFRRSRSASRGRSLGRSRSRSRGRSLSRGGSATKASTAAMASDGALVSAGADVAANAENESRDSNYENVTVRPFLPQGGEGDEVLLNPSDPNFLPPAGQCLLADVKGPASFRSWSKWHLLRQLAAGIAVALALIPECISLAYVAGLDPLTALQSAWVANLLVPVAGGRPGLVSSPSALGAVAIRQLVTSRGYGAEYVVYVVLLAGACQVLFGALRIGKFLRLLPPGITVGMVNALGLLTLALQLRYFRDFPGSADADGTDDDAAATAAGGGGEPLLRRLDGTSEFSEDGMGMPWAYAAGIDLPFASSTSQILVVSTEALASFLICRFLPRCAGLVPNTLAAMLVMTAVNATIQAVNPKIDAPTVGDYCNSELPTTEFWHGVFQPSLSLPPLFDWTTIAVVGPAGLCLFCVHLLETMTAINVADRFTGTDSEQDRIFYGQGVSNLAGGLLGGMGSAGATHASFHGLRAGGVTCASTFLAGIATLCVVSFAYPAVAVVPLGGVMGVALHLVWTTFQWDPAFGLLLKLVPSCCRRRYTVRVHWRLVVPDLLSTFATTAFALCASAHGIAGYLVGVVCYACDPISHAIITSGDNTSGYGFIELSLPKPLPIHPASVRAALNGAENERAEAEEKVLDPEEMPFPEMEDVDNSLLEEDETKDTDERTLDNNGGCHDVENQLRQFMLEKC
ncbi:hypothetical protein ACHAWF_014770 [Thalassiosira exigua]